MTKKFFTLMTLILMMSLLAACGGDDEAPEAAAPEAAAPVEEPTATPEPAAEAAPSESTESTESTETTTEEAAPAAEGVMSDSSGLPVVDPLAVEGDIITAGSSTVFPLSERMAERFQDEGYGGNITIDSIGSGAGFERFCEAGESDVSNASRPIKDSEVESCQAIGREPLEFRVGTDALAVVVSQENDFVSSLSLEELALAFSTAETWADVNPEFPAEPIQRFSPGTDSGTFDYFVEEVFDKDKEPLLAAGNVQLSEDDNVLVQGVLGSPYAIAYFGYAYYQENTDTLKPLAIEDVEPSGPNVDNGSYPLARPLYIYSTATIMEEKPQVAAFINFYLSNVNEEVIDVGYFPANPDALQAAKSAWLEAHGMEAAASDAMMASDELPMVDPLAVEGDIITAGSSTVFPLSERMAERFQDEGYGGNITIDSIGSGAGFERFCEAGESDVSNASRPIKDSEVESCQAIGREPLEFRVGTDALAVVVSQENDFVSSLSLEELALAFSTAETWADVNPEFPAEPIQRFSPGTDSGTFDYFVEEVFDKDKEPLLAAGNVQLSEDDNVLVQGVLGSPYAIAYFGYAYYQENTDTLKPLAIEDVEPSGPNVDNGSYPLARPLYIYSTATIMEEKPQVAAFINFYLSNVNEEVIDVGYFPANPDALQAAKSAWLEANKE